MELLFSEFSNAITLKKEMLSYYILAGMTKTCHLVYHIEITAATARRLIGTVTLDTSQ